MWTRAWFEEQGFEGWKTFDELNHDELPRERGVYVVLREPSEVVPGFLSDSVGGLHKLKPLTVDPTELAKNWQAGAELLYLSMAGGMKGLHYRLWAYTRQGRGFSAGHGGGRYIWQLPNIDRLAVAWRTTGELDAHDVEDALLALYIETRGDRPFANLKDGYRFTPEKSRELLSGWLR